MSEIGPARQRTLPCEDLQVEGLTLQNRQYLQVLTEEHNPKGMEFASESQKN